MNYGAYVPNFSWYQEIQHYYYYSSCTYSMYLSFALLPTYVHEERVTLTFQLNIQTPHYLPTPTKI